MRHRLKKFPSVHALVGKWEKLERQYESENVMIPCKFFPQKSRRIAMFAPSQDSPLSLDCKVNCHENHDKVVGTFEFQLATTSDVHELDQIEATIEKIGQEFKR